MPRFHFNIADGKDIPDPEGSDLADNRAAMVAAIKSISEMAAADVDEFVSTGSLRLTATDDDGLTIFALDLSAMPSPVWAGSGRGSRMR